jgi:hypothetical protein
MECTNGDEASKPGRSPRYPWTEMKSDGSHPESDPSSIQYGGLVLAVLNDFGVLIEVDEVRFQEGDWTYQGEPPIECELCGEPLHVYRRPFRAYGKDLRWWGIVCPSCPDIFGLNILESSKRRILREWEVPQETLSSDPQIAELEREHRETGTRAARPEYPLPQNEADELIVITFNDPVRGSDPIEKIEFNSDRHRVLANRLIQDSAISLFVDSNGEVVAQWQTSAIAGVIWPARMDPDQEKKDHRSPNEARMEAVRQKYPSAYARWTESEELDLCQAVEAGLSIREIAQQLGRQPGGIRSRIARLGLSHDDIKSGTPPFAETANESAAASGIDRDETTAQQ